MSLRLPTFASLVTVALAGVTGVLAGCDIGQLTAGQTAPVLARAQPALEQESDYDLAKAALPGTLKTVEGFWVVVPENDDLIGILTEGYCQYGAGFVEDDWEEATLDHNFAQVQYNNARATKMFARCLNYALKSLGDRWKTDIYKDNDTVMKLIADSKRNQRTPMMWAAIAIGSIAIHNESRADAIAMVPLVQAMLDRVIALDAEHPPDKVMLAALPHLALGLIYASRPPSLGGDVNKAKAEFQKALDVTKDKFLLARSFMAYQIGHATNDEKFFHDNLAQVLNTDPAIWPEQRLANEIAQRKARRYLSHEKDIFK